MINNSGRLGKRSSDGLGVLTQTDKFNQAVYPIPKVDSFAVTDGSYVPFNDTAADPAGGQTIVLYGSGFRSGATVMVGTTVIAVVTVLGNDRITFTSPALASGSYTVYVTNSNGGTGILVPGLVYSGMPVWSNAAGTLGSYYETTAITNTLVATGDAPMTYSITSGSLPSGATLFGNGVITGTAPADSASTTYSFTVQATDAQLQDSIRSFSLTINTDVVSWSNPSANTAYSLEQNTVMSNISLAATSAAGYGVTYAANALPTGVSLSNGVIYGTPTVVASNVSLLTATAATTTRSAVRVITWTINIAGDQYWKYTSLLLNANAAVTTSSFVNDNSLNNAVITVVGDTRAQNANPYQPGYYSVQFNGTSDYISFAASGTFAQNAFFGASKTFTVEAWLYQTSYVSAAGYYNIVIGDASGSSGINMCWNCGTNNSNNPCVAWYDGTGKIATGATALALNRWNHVAWVSTAGVVTIYVNGVSQSLTGTTTLTNATQTTGIVIGVDRANYFTGYISNLRAVSGLALYTAAFTPSATPLLPIPSTSLLACQSTRFIDSSPNNITLTVTSGPKISPATPFTTVLQAGTQYYGGYFDGTGDYLSLPSNTAFDFGTGDFCAEAWIYSTQTDTTYLKEIMGNYSTNATGNWQLVYNSISVSGDKKVGVYIGNPQGWLITSTGTLNFNSWNHVAFTRSGTTVRLFLNGVLDTSVTSSAAIGLSANFMIGSVPDTNASWPTRLWQGSISNVRIVKGQSPYTANFVPSTSPLTTTSQGISTGTVSLLTCQSSTFIDNSTNTFAITVNGDAKPLAQSPFTSVYYSGYFNGSSDYLTAPSNAVYAFGTGDFTLEAWVYPTSYNTTASWGGQIAGPHNGGVTADWWWKVSNTGYLNFQIGNSGVGAVTSSSTVPLNSWSHVVTARYNGTVTMYLNGVSFGSGSYTTSVANTLALGIGAATNGNSGTHFPGYISNLRIVKGQALYTANFTPSTSTLTTTSQGATAANVSLLTCQSLYFIDTSTNVFAITTTGSPKIAGVAPFTQPTGYSTSAVTTYGSAYFDGTGDSLTPTFLSGFNFGTGDFTIEMYAYFQTTGAYLDYFLINYGAGLAIYCEVDSTTSNHLRYTNYPLNTVTVDGPAVATNVWNHLAIVRQSGVIKLFVNGGTPTTAAETTNFTGCTSVKINNGSYAGYFSDLHVVKGTALYTSAFAPNITAPKTAIAGTQLLTLQTRGAHNNSAFSDNSGFNNLITRTGNTTNGTFAPYGNNWSYYNSSASNPIVSFPTASFTYYSGKTTIEAWVYPTVLTGGTGDTYAIVTNQDSSGAATQVNFALYSPSGSTFTLALYYTAGNQALYSTITGNKNQWSHVAVQIDCTTPGAANQVIFSINGVTDAKTVDLSNITANGYTSTALSVGGNGYYHGYFQGYMSNLRMVKTSAYVYGTSNFTPPTSPLTAITGTVLLTCQSPRFIDNSALNGTPTVGGGSPRVQKFSPFSTVTVPTYYSTYFDGNGDYLSVATNPAFAFGTGDFTIELWFNTLASFSASRTNLAGTMGTGGGLFAPTNTNMNWNAFGVGDIVTAAFVPTIGQWYHLAYSRTGSIGRLFVNGSLLVSGTDSTNYTYTIFNVGGTSTQYFNGSISNMRVTKGQALYTSAFTPSTSPLTTTSQGATAANVSLLTCQNNTFVDNSTNYFAITGNGDAKPLAVSPFTPTASSITEYTPTVFGGSMYFDGSGDCLKLTSSSLFNFGSGNFTIEFWYYKSGTPEVSARLFQTSDGDVYTGISLGLNNASNPNGIGLYVSSNGTSWDVISNSSVVTVTDFSWIHVALIRSGTTIAIYANGVRQTSFTTSAALYYSSAQYPVVGGQTGTSRSIAGYISDLRVINGTALYTSNFWPGTAPATSTYTIGATNYTSQLLLNGTAGGIVDASRIADFETAGDAKAVQNSPYSGSYYSNLFNGSTDYLSLSDNAALELGSGDFTLEAFVNFSSLPSTNGYQATIIAKMASGNYSYEFYLYNSSGTYVLYLTYSANGSAATNVGVNWTPAAGTWYHVACVRSSSNLYFFVNGAQQGTTQAVSGTFFDGTSIVTIGSMNAGANSYLNGYISNVRVVKGTALYTSAFTPSTTPLTAVANTQLLTCQSNKFVDNSSNAFAITINGTPKVQTQNPFAVNTGTAYYFDGTGDQLISPNNALFDFGSGNFTVETWVYLSASTGSVINYSNGQTSNSNFAWEMYLVSATTIQFSILNGATQYASSSASFSLNVWHHVAGVRNGNTLTTYLNGVAGGTTATVTGVTISSPAGSTLKISGWNNATGMFTGYIADPRITKGYARYTANFTPATSSLSNK